MSWLESLVDLTEIEATTADDGIGLVTLNRPERLNAITSTMISELARVVEASTPTLRSAPSS